MILFSNWKLCLLLLFCSLNVVAQSDSVVWPYVFVSPLKIVDPGNPGILYGGGIVFPAGYAVEVGHLILSSRILRVPNATNNRGDRFHLAVRKYLRPTELHRTRSYLQLRGDLLNRRHQSIVSALPPSDPVTGQTDPYLDSITVRSRITTLNVMFGVEQSIGKHFIIDLSIGLGTRWKTIRHENRINPDDEYASYLEDDEDWFYRNKPEREGGYFNIPFDMRLLYRF